MTRHAFGMILMILLAGAAGAENPGETTAWFGMGMQPATSPAGERFLHVLRTTPSGPADRAGLRAGDIITKIGNASLQHMDDLDLLLFLAHHKPGDRLPVRYVRDGKRVDTVLTVGKMSESAREGWRRALDYARRLRVNAERKQ
jgi:S1-C subfamily serine protease